MNKNNVFITGSSLICSLGETQEQIIDNVKQLDSEQYEIILQKQNAQGNLYQIDIEYETLTKRFYSVLEKTITQAIEAANLSVEKQEELAIFIGSTSMNISTDEEQMVQRGFSVIGDFIEKQINSKQGYYIFSTACTSSANALSYAARMIQHKKIKRALVVGLEFFNKSTFHGFESLLLLSKSKVYRPFDVDSDGIIIGEGCSAVVLDSKKNIESDFQYLGSANTCDNFSETTSNVDAVAVYQCMDEAIKDAHIRLSDVSIVKAHGTGSENNNFVEAKAIGQILGESDKPVCVLKPYLGHTLGACGTNEIVLLMMCAQQGFIPSARGFKKNNQLTFMPLKQPIEVKQTVTILFNFMGFSGNNTAIVLSNK